jgi:tetratricopeptide (TPR) repeat protein
MKNLRKIILFTIAILSQKNYAQPDGYWDKDRVTNQQIVVNARDKVVFKSEDLPTGTTQIIYRITLLNENQELTSSLVSLLKSIPDPTGISQGSAGAVFLLSKISGSDECKYAIFTSNNFAQNYQETGNISKACLVQNTPINKDAKLLSLNKSLCLRDETQNIWFGFESKNWIMNQKIVLEIVPWVDNKLSRGWNATNKKTTLSNIKKTENPFQINTSEVLNLSILEKIQNNYTFQEFKTLSDTEKSKTVNDFSNQIVSEAPKNSSVLQAINKQANASYANKNLENAIAILENTFSVNKNTSATDFNQLGFYYLLTKQYQKALQTIEKAEILDNANLSIKLNKAHTLLFLNQFSEAKNIYKKYQNQNIDSKTSWKQKVENDFLVFEKAGIQNNDFDKILKKLD